MHGAQHARDELVDAVTLLHQRHQRRYAALIIPNMSEVREDQLLELVDAVLQRHQVRDGLVAFVGVIDGLEAEVLLVFERAIELRMLLVERKLGEEVIDIVTDQLAIAAHAVAGHASLQAVDPALVRYSLPQGIWVAFLQQLVHGDEGLEGLDLVGEDRLAERERVSFEGQGEGNASGVQTYTFMPAQKAWEDLWSQV